MPDGLRVKQKYGGTGVELAVTKHIVEQHSGKIWAMYSPETFDFIDSSSQHGKTK
jgi:signal transduction histidine kinase